MTQEAVAEQPPITDGEGAQVDSISLNDLQVLANIVDLASQRGAFRGNELTQVGAVVDKLSAFLQQVAAAQAANAEAEGETPAEEGTKEALLDEKGTAKQFSHELCPAGALAGPRTEGRGHGEAEDRHRKFFVKPRDLL